jgi:hypothetical protein
MPSAGAQGSATVLPTDQRFSPQKATGLKLDWSGAHAPQKITAILDKNAINLRRWLTR